MTNEEKLARKFHYTYEQLAPSFGYETRKDTKQFDPETANGKLMIAVCKEILGDNKLPTEVKDGLRCLRLEVEPQIVDSLLEIIQDA